MSSALRDGFTVYELDEDGVNRWSFHVQPGTGLDGVRQPDSVIDRVAKKAQAAYNYHDRLVEALRKMTDQAYTANGHYPSDDSETFAANEDDIKQARALLGELNNLEQSQ